MKILFLQKVVGAGEKPFPPHPQTVPFGEPFLHGNA